LELTVLPVPWDELSADDVMLEVRAAGITEQDVLQRKGIIPHPPGFSPLPGMEISGRVVALGGKVTDEMLCLGDFVCALTNGGGYSDYTVVPAAQCVRLPLDIGFAEAACMPLAISTSHATREIAALEASLHALYAVGAGHLACRVLIDSVYSLDNAVHAHYRMEDTTDGRVVLSLSDEGDETGNAPNNPVHS
jgi:NADPH:quinone reductase-like Zn-dependent oxidoreductase